ncbi:hypothetical protein RRG08_006322 [Elysia crispata]|uniref:PiggyBac transposable element-derived protein domain-containing protein n=1 Tax=Elysia crispata TaxID=231223 RepID=A0AAE1D3C7_9GAST|nr:hypothetical protein RRG08_006322 [Elysia crispata]
MLRSQCLKVALPTEFSSIDEMMILFQGKYSKIKQYIQGKPHPWEFKIWARTDESGILRDFEVYRGKVENVPRTPRPSAASMIYFLDYIETLSCIYFNSYIKTLGIILFLRYIKICGSIHFLG